MSELEDVATWINICLPIVIPIVSIAFVYVKKVDKTVINLKELKKDVERLKEDVDYLLKGERDTAGWHSQH